MSKNILSAFSPLSDPISASSEAGNEFLFDQKPTEYRWHWKEDKSNTYQIDKRERIAIPELSIPDVAVLPGKAATSDALEIRKEKELLLALVQHFVEEGFSRNFECAGTITHDTADAARSLLAILPSDVEIPKIAPDGEGALVVAWEMTEPNIILIIDNWRLHLIKNATTPQAEYLDDLPFDGEQIPNAILEAILIR